MADSIFKDKTLLITGGTGSFGHTVLKHFLSTDIGEIRIFSRDEKKQDDMRHELQANHPQYAGKVKFYIGDVRNPQSIRDAMPGVNYIFHAAALKQVPSCEFFPMQAVQTNIIGTDNVLHAAIDAGVERVVCLSTDKAAYPINAMGISKAMMEHVIYANARVAAERGGTTICCTRYGNVMCSRGSVIPLFIDQIRAGNPITITDPNMTRFLMNLDEAVDLVMFAFEHANPGDLFIQKSDASTIGDLAKAVQQLFGDTGTNIIGTRHGEKLFETLMTREERLRSEDMGGYYRVAADNRDLNYDKFVVKGEVHTMADDSLHEPQHAPSGRGGHGQEDPDHRLRPKRAERDGGRKGMKILVTGANGFVGRNLCENLKAVRDGKNRTRPALQIEDVFEYDLDTPPAELDHFCAEADFVFNLAGVNRPKNNDEFMQGNFGFASTLLDTLKSHANRCPVMLSSSIQATLIGRYGESDYGKSKLAGEELFFTYGQETGAPVLVYRFPNLFGKWCRPNYNSAVATFCHNTANDLPITVNDRATELELLYIDDLVEEMLDALEGKPHRCDYDGLTPVFHDSGRYCAAPVTHKVTLGEIADLLERFKAQPATLVLPEIPAGSFAKKLYSTYLSYLPKEKVIFDLKKNEDARGSFTELLKTESCGQFSVNVSKPGITKGQHWHNTKWEFFIVVSGHGLIQERRVGSGEVLEFEVTGDKPQAIHMLPGYTHNIINLSETENLVTLMWANEQFDPAHPDTFFEKV